MMEHHEIFNIFIYLFDSLFLKYKINCYNMKLFLSVCLLFAIVSCNNNKNQNTLPDSSKTEMVSPDDAAIQKAVNDAYAWISFKKGTKPDYEKIHDYFIPQAILINFSSDSMVALNVDQFVAVYKDLVERGQIQSFYEEELFGKTDQFGHVAQRLSTYKTYINTMDSVSERGVNSFQLVKTPAGWKVSSIIWDIEKPGLPIPEAYLPKK